MFLDSSLPALLIVQGVLAFSATYGVTACPSGCNATSTNDVTILKGDTPEELKQNFVNVLAEKYNIRINPDKPAAAGDTPESSAPSADADDSTSANDQTPPAEGPDPLGGSDGSSLNQLIPEADKSAPDSEQSGTNSPGNYPHPDEATCNPWENVSSSQFPGAPGAPDAVRQAAPSEVTGPHSAAEGAGRALPPPVEVQCEGLSVEDLSEKLYPGDSHPEPFPSCPISMDNISSNETQKENAEQLPTNLSDTEVKDQGPDSRSTLNNPSDQPDQGSSSSVHPNQGEPELRGFVPNHGEPNPVQPGSNSPEEPAVGLSPAFPPSDTQCHVKCDVTPENLLEANNLLRDSDLQGRRHLRNACQTPPGSFCKYYSDSYPQIPEVQTPTYPPTPAVPGFHTSPIATQILLPPCASECTTHQVENIVRPCVQEIVTCVPVRKKTVRNHVVCTRRYVPVSEKMVLPQHEKYIRQVPVEQKVTRTVIDYVTRHVPVTRHRNRTVEEIYTEHVPVTENTRKTLVETLLKKVPVVVSCVKPVVHKIIRHIPVVETRYKPVVTTTITTVPVKQRIVKNLIECRIKPLHTPYIAFAVPTFPVISRNSRPFALPVIKSSHHPSITTFHIKR